LHACLLPYGDFHTSMLQQFDHTISEEDISHLNFSIT